MAHYSVRGGGTTGDGSWGRTIRTNVVREFEEYDQTPYGGGYDITQVYGRPLPPSEETCYPITRTASNVRQSRPPVYSTWGKKIQQPDAYGAPGGGFGKSSHPQPQPQPAHGFHPHQEVEIGDGRHDVGYGRGSQPKVDYGFHPGAHKPGGYEQHPSELGYGYTGSGPSHREDASQGFGYGKNHQTGTGYPVMGYGAGRGYADGGVYKKPQDHGNRSRYMEQVYGPVSSFGREPPTIGQVEQISHETYQRERFDGSKYADDIGIEEKKHYQKKYRHHH